MFHKLKLPTLSLLCVTTINVQAANVTQINRYATVENKPLIAQINPLLAVQQIHFPQTVQTIGQAVTYWLQYSGFHIAPQDKLSSDLQLTFNQPLPQVSRNLGPLSVIDGLEVLVGKSVFTAIINPLLREVNFTIHLSQKPQRRKA